MSTARIAFVQRVDSIQTVLDNPLAIDSHLPPQVNGPAAITRNGCMVMLFCVLESFLRDRAIEVLAFLDRASVPYGKLPEQLRTACVINTFQGLLNTTRNSTSGDRIQEFERIIPLVSAGLSGSNYRFSEYAFGRDKSNLGQEDIKQFMMAFGISDPWGLIKRTAGRLGALLSNGADTEFKNLASNRHKAAHVAGFVIDHPTISSALPIAKGIAIGFDINVSAAVKLLNSAGLAMNRPIPTINNAQIKLRCIERHPSRSNHWMVKGDAARRASAIGTDPDLLFANSVVAARSAMEALVLKDRSGRPSNWTTVLD